MLAEHLHTQFAAFTLFTNNFCRLPHRVHCKSRPSQYELHIPWKELDLFAWGRQSLKLVWYVSTKNFCFSFPEICRSNVIVHLRTVISLFDMNYKLVYRTINFLFPLRTVIILYDVYNKLLIRNIFPYKELYISIFRKQRLEELYISISEYKDDRQQPIAHCAVLSSIGSVQTPASEPVALKA